MDMAFRNTFIALFFAYLFEEVFVWFKVYRQTKNLSETAVIDEFFLI